ncbi:MAG: undecaprenyl/decaprenyl-phosphate alpha-N-acetylglucosaminyl 1-phosphate transferase [Acidobacteriaceae bacterium]|nr:undecaprenyl/decaprenyl-phosphate alpha-N-acetylglucosaminyl 1-phosphate transferase [Acidobacteriaceae bacterium]
MAYTGALGLILLISHHPVPVHHPAPVLVKLLLAGFLVFMTGLMDDVFGLKPWQKLCAETLASLIAIFSGIQIQGFQGHMFASYVAAPLTLIWLVGCTNAFNLIDGVDGLATGIGFIASVTTMIAGALHGDAGLVVATAPLAGALLAFLIFNINPASIFLGDSGSLWVGFMLACYSVMWSKKSVTALSVTAPIMALCIPLLDAGLAVARRYVRAQPIFTADRAHIHHRLLDRGLSPRRTAFLLCAASAVGAGFSILQSTAPNYMRFVIMFVFCIVAWFGIRYLHYQEFDVAIRVLRKNNIRSIVKSHFSLNSCEQKIMAANSVDDCWSAVRTIAVELGFTHVDFVGCGQHFEAPPEKPVTGHWSLQVPLSDSEYVRFGCQFEIFRSAAVVAQLADLLHRTLSTKMNDFRQQATEGERAAISA